MGSNCSMRKGESGQADLGKGFKTGYFSLFNHQACDFHLCDKMGGPHMRKKKAGNNKTCSHKTRVGVLDSLRKLFNTPTLVHLSCVDKKDAAPDTGQKAAA